MSRDLYVIMRSDGTYYWDGREPSQVVAPADRWCRSALAAKKFPTADEAEVTARAEGLRCYTIGLWE